jgi:hypothetical protein
MGGEAAHNQQQKSFFRYLIRARHAGPVEIPSMICFNDILHSGLHTGVSVFYGWESRKIGFSAGAASTEPYFSVFFPPEC